MKKFQDIQLSDFELKEEFVRLFLNENYEQAFQILENNPQLDSKEFVADVLNILTNMLLTLEGYYKTNFVDFLELKLVEFNTMINNFIKRGIWSSTAIYQKYHFVNYNTDIYMYINDTSSSGNLPTDTNYWLYLGLNGEKGSPAIGTTMKFQWLPDVNYNRLDVVVYADMLYVALRNNISRNPQTSPADWQKFLSIPKAKILVSYNYPTDRYKGMIFWKIVTEPYTFEQVDALNYTFDDADNLNMTWSDIDLGGW